MSRLQDYYGPYPSRQDASGNAVPSKVPSYVLAYLKRDIDPEKLDQLFRFITYYHPARFGPPGISDIEKAINQARYDGKGSDVHKGPPAYQPPIEDMPTDEEKREADRMIAEAGGLQNLFRKMVHEKRYAHQEEEF
jgi:hypothetical protein